MFYKRALTFLLALTLALSLCACGAKAPANDGTQMITDGVGRQVTITPGTYQRVVCIGAGALRMYTYVGDTALLCGVEDIDNTSLTQRPKMFDSVARPYLLAMCSRRCPPAAPAAPTHRRQRPRKSSPAARTLSSQNMRMWKKRMPCRLSWVFPSSR